MPEEGSRRVATRKQAGLGRVGTAGRERVNIAQPTTQGILQGQQLKGYCRADNILQGQRGKGSGGDTIAGPTKARIRFGGMKIVRRIRKPWEGKRPAGGGISVGLVRRRSLEDQRKTDIRGISKVVVGRAVLLDFDIGRSKCVLVITLG
ncbi:hypothetical protein BY996DRAFT_6546447 [Phakopsora pachyrhizi]|nr:hypothetical protein BY996DRAFT_6546447 [Phakopsora pachyrhizi]